MKFKLAFLYLILSIFPAVSFAQETADSLWEQYRATRYLENEEIDIAFQISILHTIHEKYPDFDPEAIIFSLGKCYYEMNDFQKAEGYLLESLNYRRSHFISLETFNMLSDSYIKLYQYEKALVCLDSAELYIPKGGCGRSKYSKKVRIKILKAQAFEGQGKLDLAIKVLTPCAFDIEFDSEYPENFPKKESAKLYISILQKLYSDSDIKTELQHAIKNLVYTDDMDTEEKNYQTNKEYSWVTATFSLFGNTVIFKDTYWFNDIESTKYSKEDFIADFKNSLVFHELSKQNFSLKFPGYVNNDLHIGIAVPTSSPGYFFKNADEMIFVHIGSANYKQDWIT